VSGVRCEKRILELFLFLFVAHDRYFGEEFVRKRVCRDGEFTCQTYLNEANKLDGSNFINWKFKM
jgi:hypothetical protein